ncbi:MAG: toprim domain-containing protein [Oxalobacter sp.]|nr:toprim domain-containing protein [Oxalobacter sp.]
MENDKKTATQTQVAKENHNISDYITNADALEQFRKHIYGVLGYAPESIEPDGKVHRFSTSAKAADKAGWYVCFQTDYASGESYAGAFGDFRQGISDKWSLFNRDRLSKPELISLSKRQSDAAKKAQKERVQEQQEAAEYSNRLWNESLPASDSHPYLVRKKVKPFGLRQAGGTLLIPVLDENGKIFSLQKIEADGRKLFQKNGIVKGNFFTIGTLDGKLPVCICEGYATGATIHQETGYPVVCCFGATNLVAVSEKIRKAYPCRKIIICADNDAHLETEGKVNVGVQKAKEAAKAIEACLSIPPSPDGRSIDFNDLYLAQLAQGGA